jgi:hypothetical protein
MRSTHVPGSGADVASIRRSGLENGCTNDVLPAATTLLTSVGGVNGCRLGADMILGKAPAAVKGRGMLAIKGLLCRLIPVGVTLCNS